MCSRGECAVHIVIRVIVSILLLLVAIAAAIGVWHTHMTPAGWSFGTTDASLAILAFVVALVACHKVSKKLCSCGKCCCGKCGNCPCTCNTGMGKDMGKMK